MTHALYNIYDRKIYTIKLYVNALCTRFKIQTYIIYYLCPCRKLYWFGEEVIFGWLSSIITQSSMEFTNRQHCHVFDCCVLSDPFVALRNMNIAVVLVIPISIKLKNSNHVIVHTIRHSPYIWGNVIRQTVMTYELMFLL